MSEPLADRIAGLVGQLGPLLESLSADESKQLRELEQIIAALRLADAVLDGEPADRETTLAQAYRAAREAAK